MRREKERKKDDCYLSVKNLFVLITLGLETNVKKKREKHFSTHTQSTVPDIEMAKLLLLLPSALH